jgi:hypothetical protein
MQPWPHAIRISASSSSPPIRAIRCLKIVSSQRLTLTRPPAKRHSGDGPPRRASAGLPTLTGRKSLRSADLAESRARSTERRNRAARQALAAVRHEALVTALPLNTVAYDPEPNATNERVIWLKEAGSISSTPCASPARATATSSCRSSNLAEARVKSSLTMTTHGRAHGEVGAGLNPV